jgi:hypothetical protein
VGGGGARALPAGAAAAPDLAARLRAASTPPAWGVLDTSRAAGDGITLRDWRDALEDYLPAIC